MKTLHEQLIRLKAEEVVKKLGLPISILDAEEEETEPEKLPETGELVEQAQRLVDEMEQFFARFGLTEDKQEELFQMPIIQEWKREIMFNVFREREELERTISKPRDGWKALPFEKSINAEKVLQELPDDMKSEKVKEIHLDSIFDTSAEEQIAAISKRLSEALEDVQKAVAEQKEVLSLPSLPKRNPAAQVEPAMELPDLREKRQIEAHTAHHYADELRVVFADPDPLKKAMTKLSTGTPSVVQKNVTLGEGESLGSPVPAVADAPKNEIRSSEEILADIEKMVKKPEKVKESVSVVVPEVVESTAAGYETVTLKKMSGVRPRHGIVISALKSQIQREQNSQVTILTEPFHGESNQNPFADPALSQLPEMPMVVDFNDPSGACHGETEKAVAIRRLGMGPKKIFL
ncbi:MAG: hypothetical protein LBJ13_01755 [Puniceicoccales bacterium]|jgi:hypothetical protein|nr:hypothetical protein [Puniceicoccales bacterium]